MLEEAFKNIQEMITSKEFVETIRFNKLTVTLKLKGQPAEVYGYRSAVEILESIEFAEKQLKK